mmetsp:Transcript_12921/g.13024  ORF Transcript_12921/g.13024 Transcript_12921/m.13024 type:complete len:547 (+) Transcript_12921:292-1932(+)
MICRSEGEFKKKQKEAELQISMKHPNICKCITAFLDQSYQYGYKYVIVMEFSENGDVEQDIENRRLRNNPWSETDLMTHMTDLIDAFAYLQEKNLSHGDVKPRNLFIANDGKMKIGDFGESRQGMHALVTRTYQVTGTVIYFSPLLFKAYLEIIKGKNVSGDVRHNPIKSDVYSLGLSFLHMASLNKPIELNNLEIGSDALQNQVERAISKLNYPERIKMLLDRMLQVPENRRSDFVQLRASLTEIMTGSPAAHPASQSAPATPRNDARLTTRTPSRSQSLFTGPTLFSLAQTPGKANIYSILTRKITSMSCHRFQYSSRAVIIGENVLLTGGLKNPKNTFSINLKSSASTKQQDMNVPRAWHSMAILGDLVYVIGGRNPETKDALASVEIYNNENWELISPMQRKRENATSVVFDQNIYVVGGSNKDSGRWDLLSSIEKFENSVWNELEIRLPEPMSGVALIKTAPNNILMVGGARERGAYSQNTYHWNIESNEIVPGTPIDEGDAFTSCCSYLDEEKIVVIGQLMGVFEYTIASNQWELMRFKC